LSQPDTTLSVDILADGVIFDTVLADQNRFDLTHIGVEPNSGFSLATPSFLQDHNAHLITAQVSGTTNSLVGSYAINCP
jgi:hypothetical protein